MVANAFKCDLDQLRIVLETINSTMLLYAKNKENYDIQRDGHWIVTREHGNQIEIIKKNIEEILITLYSNANQKAAGFFGIVGELSFLKAKMAEMTNLIRCTEERRDEKEEKTKEEIKSLLRPITESVASIEKRNIAKDAIYSWKAGLPVFIVNIITIIGIIISSYFAFK